MTAWNKQFARQREQLFVRQTAMTVVHRLGERKRYAGSYADKCRLLDAEFGRNLVGGAESDAADVAGQPIGVFGNQPNGIGAIGLVDTNRPRRADAIAVQEQHDLANHLLLSPARDDPLGALGADTGDLTQASRLLLDDVEYGFAKTRTSFFAYTGPMPRIIPEPRYFSMPSTVVGAVALRNEALNWTPCVRSLTHAPLAWTNSPAEIIAA